jgi:DNA-binding transcriptional MerR regulator
VTTETRVTLVPVAVRPRTINIEAVARESGLHPEVVRRFVKIGLIEPAEDGSQSPRFALDAPAMLARAARLRRDLGLGYGGAVLASQLLDRIGQLEAQLRNQEREMTRWTRRG